ncbi:MAG TPA: glycosyltransferase family 4 protein [Gaiellales bacterium]|jgi:glycosyltransferase involved in cell wall biosynthesis|nr:glycosyltransferase family 4 protein [Gaiellales bacterium]
MRVLMANPPGYGGPDYDDHLCTELGRLGVEVDLVTSHFRFGDVPRPRGYRRRELFYPVSSRIFGRSRLRIPLKVAEHPLGLARMYLQPADLVHLQWMTIPELDTWLLRARAPMVFTAHDVVPRRTGRRRGIWQRLYDRFQRIVVHSDAGREAMVAQGIPEQKLRVIPHPIIRSEPSRTDDGRTLLCFGLIRPYKGIDDAIEVAKRVPGTRLIVAGDPMEPVDRYRAAGGDLVDWRLGYLPQGEVDRAYGDSTLAVFPYRPGLDQSGTLLRALGAGVPAVTYDVGGLGENVRRFSAGTVVPSGDIDAMAEAVRELLDDPAKLEAAREGARAARDALTWEASARMHVDLYSELLARPRPAVPAPARG